MTKIPDFGPNIPIIGAKGMERDTASAEEAAAMIMVQQSVFRMLDQLKAPKGVQINGMISVLATMAAVSVLPRDRTDEEWQDAVAEAFRRVFDAMASMEDYHHRAVPWKPQSTTVKNAERGGGGVKLVAAGAKEGKPS